MFGALAQYERALTQERVRAGITAAQRRGKRGGRPRAVSDAQWTSIAAGLEGGMSKVAVRRTFGSKRSTLYNRLARSDHDLRDAVRPGCSDPRDGGRLRRAAATEARRA